MRGKVGYGILLFDHRLEPGNMPLSRWIADRAESGQARGSLFAVLVSLAMPAPGMAERISSVDLELVLCADVSSSMSEEELHLQREGYVSALRDPVVLRSIKSGRLGKIAIAYVEWAGPNYQRVLVPWTVLDTPDDAAGFARTLRVQPILRGHGTSITGALLAAGKLLEGRPIADRMVIDVSGDGPNNAGLPLQPVHDALIGSGVTINGLAISLHATDTPDSFGPGYVELYYENCVIGGSGAFILTVGNTADFAKAIRNKLVSEIAGFSVSVQPAAFQIHSRRSFDCVSIGEGSNPR